MYFDYSHKTSFYIGDNHTALLCVYFTNHFQALFLCVFVFFRCTEKRKWEEKKNVKCHRP